MDYSLIICTHNPDVRILLRCFSAVAALITEGLTTEVIVVDNNSPVPVASIPDLKPYLHSPGWRLLNEERQGVQFARMTAIRNARGKHIVYIDSDNEPAPDYLLKADQLVREYPQVGAWGPGVVNVDLIDGISPELEDYARGAFQQRKETEPRFALTDEWQSCYPFGTGLCIRAEVLHQYVKLADQGRFTMEGRSGQKLSSGEDTQMVLLCIKMGYAAGVSPQLKLTHIIPAARANAGYLRRLAYGTSLCYASCLTQVFPEKRQLIRKQKMPQRRLVRKSLKKWIRLAFNNDAHRSFELAFFIGNNCSNYIALGEPIPLVVRFIIRRLKLE
ncbi:MAG: hypothetical protein DI535_19630 [Citrobacter freundii]|nr:MAG: hypothetical protein DI535_19630 [Citrobacter freundii]